jgi:hypothetical protein
MIESIKEFMIPEPQDKKKEEVILHLKKEFRLSLIKLKKQMNELIQRIFSANKIYNYCPRWPHAIGNYKENLNKIEEN